MQRYFLEVFYKGNKYSGFQIQDNAATIQSEIQKAFLVLQKKAIILTGSSRTDAEVHAFQNFFHFDFEEEIHSPFLYKINAILPADIVVRNIYKVSPETHCRFDASSRTYQYHIYQHKTPFLADRAYFFPYTIDIDKMQAAASILKEYTDFSAFSKRNTQVTNHRCSIIESEWKKTGDELIYCVKANRFLRGMVRGLTGTMLQVGRGKITIEAFISIIESKDCTKANFAVPGYGLFLMQVTYPKTLLLLPVW